MKNEYVFPELKMVKLADQDVMVASGGGETTDPVVTTTTRNGIQLPDDIL